MATESGYSSQKKIGEAQFKTIHNLGSDRFGASVSPKSVYELSAIPTAITDVMVDENHVYFEVVSHGARIGDILRITSGSLEGLEFPIEEIIDANTIKVINLSFTVPAVSDEAKVMRWITNKTDREGNVNFSPGPTQFVKDGSASQVIQDTAIPTNNKPLPSGMYFIKDGVAVPVSKDTGDASGTAAMPVEIVGVDGTTINITAGDINVQLTDLGTNFDATRIGDGSGFYLKVNSDGSLNVKDADSLTQLTALVAKDFATSAKQDLLKASVDGMSTKVDSLSTSVKQDELKTSVDAMSVKINSLATIAKQNQMIALLPSSIGQKTKADSLSVVIASDAPLALDTTLLSKEAKQDNQITLATSANTKLDNIAGKLPSTIGQKAAADSLSVVFATGTGVSVTGVSTEAKQDTQTVELTAIKTGITSSNTKLDAVKTAVDLNTTKTAGALVTVAHNEIVTAYVGTTSKIQTVTYKQDGVTVATLTFGYDVSDRLTSVMRS